MTSSLANLLGYAASCAVLASFLMRTMVPLRLVAILSNLLFLAFGYIQHIYPVFFLHIALLPINTWRLVAVRQWRAIEPSAAKLASAVAPSPRPGAVWFTIGLMAGLAGAITVVVMMNPGLL
jgi:hypothetical protein